MTNEECIKKFMLEYQHKLEKGTLYKYFWGIRHFLAYSQLPFHEVTARDIRKWLLKLQKEQVPGSINSKISGLKMFYRFCYEDALMAHNPTTSIHFQYVPDKPIYYLNLEQLSQLRQKVENDRKQRALIEILYATGMRIGEATAIKIEDINWSERLIHISKGKRKRSRIVCFTRECAEHLNIYLSERTDKSYYLFCNEDKAPSYIRKVQYQFQANAKALGFRVTPHVLRHTFAAHLAKKGMPFHGIQTLLGHEDPQQTLLYSRLYEDARKEIYDQWM